jgi:predicted nucleotidyltransferase
MGGSSRRKFGFIMLADRIHNTLRFFDLQEFPLSAFEMHKYLIADLKNIQSKLDGQYELSNASPEPSSKIHLDTILSQLQIMTREGRIVERKGFYALPGREDLIDKRLRNHLLGIKRERRLRRVMGFTRLIPFVRGVALLGSQAMGQQKSDSDIDLFIITDTKHIGIARTLLTIYFQILGVRRHGNKIANRICLNHYLAGPRTLISDRNLYTAYEYLKHRPLVYGHTFQKFLANNEWVYLFFPNAKQTYPLSMPRSQSGVQKFLEKLFKNSLGDWLELKLLTLQLQRIQSGQFTISNQFELSFHPLNRKSSLFEKFFKAHPQNNPKMN